MMNSTAVQKKLKMHSSLMGEAASHTTTLIQGDGTFNADKLDKFIKQVKLGKCGVSYVVVAIMGPQSSGKSTLLNHLFYTNFKEMDAEEGRQQTTKGVWIAKCAGIEPCTIVMDDEGSDGSEREDDTKFEKQSALFVLAVSHIVMINMWCHDIGREQAANRPLLKTVFEVMLRLLITPRKTTLMFVIRDKTKTPLKKLESLLRNDIQKVWDSVTKPEAHKHTPLSEFFNVEVVALDNYETYEEQFKKQVASLRQKFFHSISPGGLAGDRREVVDASGFSISAKLIWERIKANKQLDLPSHKLMVATIRCDEISSEKYSSFLANKEWLKLEKDVQSHLVPGFGKLLSSLLCNCLSSYDEETTYYEDYVTTYKRKQLEEKLLKLIQPAYNLMLERIRSATLAKFKEAVSDVLKGGQGVEVAVQNCIPKFTRLFDKQCEDIVIKQADWPDTTRTREELLRDFDLHITKAERAKLIELSKEAAKKNNILEVGVSAAKVLGGLGGSLVSNSLLVAGTTATSEVAGITALGALGGATVGFAGALACYAAYKAYKAKKHNNIENETELQSILRGLKDNDTEIETELQTILRGFKDNDTEAETELQTILRGLKDNDIEIETELQTILRGLKDNDIEIETELQTILRRLKDNDNEIETEWQTILRCLKDNDTEIETELQTILRGLKDNDTEIETELQTILRDLKDNDIKTEFEEEEKGDEDEDDNEDEDEDDVDDEDEG